MPIHVFPRDFRRLSRRSFLILCAGGCTHVALNNGKSLKDLHVTWALISDTHVRQETDWREHGSNMAANLVEAVRDIVAARPDAILVNGDMAFSRGEPSDYATFHRLTAPLHDLNVPIHFTLGNHDHRERFLATLRAPEHTAVDGRWATHFVDHGLHWILLDSLARTNDVSGNLGHPQIAWMARTLDAEPHRPAVIFIHHNPEATPVGLTNTADFLDVVVPRRQAKAVFFGHTHAWRAWQQDGLHFINLPATGYAFVPGVSLGWMLATFRPDGLDLSFRQVGRTPRPDLLHHSFAWRAT